MLLLSCRRRMQSTLASKLVMCLWQSYSYAQCRSAAFFFVCMSLLQGAVSYIYTSTVYHVSVQCWHIYISAKAIWRAVLAPIIRVLSSTTVQVRRASGSCQCDECHDGFHCTLLTANVCWLFGEWHLGSFQICCRVGSLVLTITFRKAWKSVQHRSRMQFKFFCQSTSSMSCESTSLTFQYTMLPLWATKISLNQWQNLIQTTCQVLYHNTLIDFSSYLHIVSLMQRCSECVIINWQF